MLFIRGGGKVTPDLLYVHGLKPNVGSSWNSGYKHSISISQHAQGLVSYRDSACLMQGRKVTPFSVTCKAACTMPAYTIHSVPSQ
jgi:hypothetical protein